MAREMTTAKISVESLKLLRLAAALTGERQYAILERVLKAELQKIKKRENNEDLT